MEERLNVLLSDLVVEYHKLQNYHWYAKGRNFFTVHEKLEEYFRAINELIDEVAETMLMQELKPVASLTEFLATTQITEAKDGHIKGFKIFNEVIADFEYFKELTTTIKTHADQELNYQVSALMDGCIAMFAKNIWMIKQVLTEVVEA